MEALGLSGRSVLVTGGFGLIGSWLVRELVQRGARVVVVDRDGLDVLGVGASVQVVGGDVCSEGLVERALADYAVDSVFHLAAQTQVGTAARAPLPTFESNVRGTWTVLEACRRVGVERMIVASSDKAYGPAERLPYREDDALRPLYPYDASKAACDLIARSYWHTFGLPVAVTRLSNVYGGGDLNGSRLMPEAVCAALAGAPPVIRSDGSPERDFLYVSDAVRAYLAVWAALPSEAACGQAFNAGSGSARRVDEVVALVCRLAGSSAAPDVRGSSVPAGEIDRQWVDFAKLQALTGWRPLVGLEEGLRLTIEWYRAHTQAQRAVRAS